MFLYEFINENKNHRFGSMARMPCPVLKDEHFTSTVYGCFHSFGRVHFIHSFALSNHRFISRLFC